MKTNKKQKKGRKHVEQHIFGVFFMGKFEIKCLKKALREIILPDYLFF